MKMDSALLKKIGNDVIQGDFEEMLDVIETHQCLSQKQAMFLLACICKCCINNLDILQEFKTKDVIRGIKVISKQITNVTTVEFDTYTQSIYHICKVLLKKDYSLLIQLETEIIPTFIPVQLTDVQRGVYKSLCVLINNEIIRMAQKKMKVNEKQIISLGYMMIRILLKSSNEFVFIENVSTLGTYLAHLNCDLKLQYEYLQYIVNIIQQLTNEDRTEGVIHFLNFAMFIFSAHLNHAMVDESKRCFEIILCTLPDTDKWLHLKDLLKLCIFILNPNLEKGDLIICQNNLRNCYELYKNTAEFNIVCKVITQGIVSFTNYCKKYKSKMELTEPDLHLSLYDILWELITIFTTHQKKCGRKCVCTVSKNVTQGKDLVVAISILMELLLSNNDLPKIHIEYFIDTLKRYCKFLISIKNYYDKMENCWSDISFRLHNVGVALLKRDKYEDILKLGHIVLHSHAILGRIENTPILLVTSNLLSSVCLKLLKYEEALIWTAVEIINTDERSNPFYRWIKIKKMARGNEAPSELQEHTVVSIIKKIAPEYECYTKNIIKTQAQIEVLIAELEVYQQKWRSKIPMLSAFRQLYDIADNITFVTVLLKIYSDDKICVHPDLIILSEKVFVEFEKLLNKSLDKKLKILLIFLYVFRYKTQSVELISRNIEEMNRNIEVLKPSSYTVDIMPADANDQCDVVSVYENLRIDGKKLKHLERSLEELEDLLTGEIPTYIFREIEMERLYALSKYIALEFDLHNDTYNTFKAFYLLYIMAKLTENESFILESTGHLLKLSQHIELGITIENIIPQLKEAEGLKYLIQFYINLSYHYMALRNIPAAFEKFNMALKLLSQGDDKDLWYEKTSIELLHFEIMLESKISKQKIGLQFSFGPLVMAHNIIIEKYETEPQWTPSALKLLLKVLETMVKVYHDLKMPRQVRCFGRKLLSLAQRYIIPITSAKILGYLAFADFRSERMDDFRVKVEGIAEILLIENGKQPTTQVQEKIYSTAPEIDEIIESVQEIVLDVPKPSAYNVNESISSPVLIGKPYRTPLFADHENCDCLKCTSIDYHQTSIWYFHLEAIWYKYKGQVVLADSFFKGAIRICMVLTEKKAIISNIFNNCTNITLNQIYHTTNFMIDHNYRYDERNFHCLVDFIKFQYSSGALQIAKKWSENLVNQMEQVKFIYPHLYGEALLLRMGLLYKREVAQNRLSSQTEISKNNVCETPVKSIKEIPGLKIAPLKSKKYLPSKVIKFNLTDSETEDVSTKSSQKLQQTSKEMMLPPSLKEFRTPLLHKSPGRSNRCSIVSPSTHLVSKICLDDVFESDLPTSSRSRSRKQTCSEDRALLKDNQTEINLFTSHTLELVETLTVSEVRGGLQSRQRKRQKLDELKMAMMLSDLPTKKITKAPKKLVFPSDKPVKSEIKIYSDQSKRPPLTEIAECLKDNNEGNHTKTSSRVKKKLDEKITSKGCQTSRRGKRQKKNEDLNTARIDNDNKSERKTRRNQI